MTVGSIIKSARLKKGYTQADLANKLQLTRQAVQLYEKDKIADIPPITRLRLCEILELDYSELMTLAEVKECYYLKDLFTPIQENAKTVTIEKSLVSPETFAKLQQIENLDLLIGNYRLISVDDFGKGLAALKFYKKANNIINEIISLANPPATTSQQGDNTPPEE